MKTFLVLLPLLAATAFA
jgi:mono/diheme cytochrome c family protein